MTYSVAALYRFTPVPDPAALRLRLLDAFRQLELCGSLLIAPEGINGTLAGSQSAVEEMCALLENETGLTHSDIKFSQASEKPFNKLKVRLKRELITFNQPEADPTKRCGQYVMPRDWNNLISDPEVVVLDTRNVYETMIGTFAGAQDPNIEKFTDFAAYVRENLDPTQHKKIAMYCTGGIRCEKASAFMLAEGFEEVYHLKGGILKYLEEVPAQQSLWNGECYVFDRRMAVGHGLATGHYSMCFCCGYPLSAEDKTHKDFEEGVSCAHCFETTGATDKEKFRARHRQMTTSQGSVQQHVDLDIDQEFDHFVE